MTNEEANDRIEEIVKVGFCNTLTPWYVEFHCDNKPRCDVREVEIRVAEPTWRAPRARAPFACPACGGTKTTVNWIKNIDEYWEERERRVRQLINARALYDA